MTTITYKKDGSVELSHNGKVIHFWAVSKMINYMREHNITEDKIITE